MKHYNYLFLLLLLFISCSHIEPHRKIAAEVARPRHIIFLVHGIAAGRETFGHMSEALTKHLNEQDSADYIVENFVYATHNNKNNTEQFAKDLGNTINQYFLENGEINPQDKISIIAHSQGGLVSLIWIYRAALGDAEYNSKYIEHLDAFITLGTPFWGAKIALFGDTIKRMASKLNKNFLPFFGTKQLEDMSFGSPVIFNFRKNTIELSFQDILKKLNLQMRPVNFGGAAHSMKLLSPFAAGLKEYEDDSAVPLPSSRFDFIYASSIKSGYSDKDVLQSSEFNETHFAPFHVVDALHVSLMPAIPLWSAIAFIPKRCVENAECNHPTYKYILGHIKHETKIPDEKLLSKMTAYLLDINVRLPNGDKLPAKKIKIKLRSDDSDLKGFDPKELYGHGHSPNYENENNMENYRHFYFTGTAANSFIPEKDRTGGMFFKDKTMSIKISAPGYKSRLIEAKVRPTYSTFIEINLEKN
jgi:pimeloyl-ACP methyl ester carboxylesterase